jgi:hypothetical protein
MALEIAGKVIALLPEQTGTGKNGNWVKQDFVIETTAEQFPKKVCFSSWGDKAALVKNLQTGQTVKVSFNVESREFNGKWYTDLRIWKLETNSGTSENQSVNDNDAPFINEKQDFLTNLDDDDKNGGLPF